MRLLTRSDFDGAVCAALLLELNLIDSIEHVHPKDIQDNKIEITENDVLANIPFVEGCGMWFDHHASENERLDLAGTYVGACEPAPSAARVIFNYYKADENNAEKLKNLAPLIDTADKADSAQFSKEEILNPQGWTLLAFIADPRTGLGYHRSYRISNLDMLCTLPELLRTKTAEEILALPDFQERVKRYEEQTEKYKDFIASHSKSEGNAIIVDVRGTKEIPSGNRFIEYTLYPEQNISIRIADGKNNEFTMVSLGHSIINRTSTIGVGSLMLQYGGGGHDKVGTCQVALDEADRAVRGSLETINPKDGPAGISRG